MSLTREKHYDLRCESVNNGEKDTEERESERERVREANGLLAMPYSFSVSDEYQMKYLHKNPFRMHLIEVALFNRRTGGSWLGSCMFHLIRMMVNVCIRDGFVFFFFFYSLVFFISISNRSA